MQFTINLETNDGNAIARQLVQWANLVRGKKLDHHWRNDVENGHALMIHGVESYESCAEAERRYGLTLRWSDRGDHFWGYDGNTVVANVDKKVPNVSSANC